MKTQDLVNYILRTGQKGYKDMDDGLRISDEMTRLVEERINQEVEKRIVENTYRGFFNGLRLTGLRKDEFLFDLTALISEHYVAKEEVGYPKEFVEWIGDDCSPCYLEREEDDYGKWVVFKKGSMEHEVEFDTLAELYKWWRENEDTIKSTDK